MIYALSPDILDFPPVEHSEPDGLLAIGGDLSPERLLLAYRSGIFPWYSENSKFNYLGNKILWWSPDPRFVIFPEKVHVSKSMGKLLKKGVFEITFNKAFPQVISRCRHEVRVRQEGTWITDEMEKSYNELHRLGYAISVEAWVAGTGNLAGGLYGVMLGKAFFGESMFSIYENASKAAFITFMQVLQKAKCPIVDCQVETDHLKSLGAEFISRKEFVHTISKAAKKNTIDFNKL
ncbi:MAG TPA: leucyl/phenylalanyl-tRNA--protein transferase [bacterium]|jgi:leucyl/phenylalanyl-tRNA--protein transferase|nr:leucyl/phenylalanyl-tRNA--protein transferase [bacterium]HNZ54080.1 leucyl/phenylalanyl-tRNA--protein transferase [bacterium]